MLGLPGGEDIGERGGDRSGRGTQSPAETAVHRDSRWAESSSGRSEGVCTQSGLQRHGPGDSALSALHPL